MSDLVNSPKHYNSHPSSVEAIELCQFMDFCLGNAVKYLFRAGHKDPVVQDLRKAVWYLRRAIERPAPRLLPVGAFPRVFEVIDAEPEGSVLRDALEYLIVHTGTGSPPRIADALVRVEREIAARS